MIDVADGSLGNKWRNVSRSDEGRMYRWNEVGFHVGLDDIPQSAFRGACFHELLFRMNRQEHNSGCRGQLAQSMRCIDSAQTRHCNVSHNDVRAKTEGLRYQSYAIRYSPHYFKLRL